MSLVYFIEVKRHQPKNGRRDTSLKVYLILSVTFIQQYPRIICLGQRTISKIDFKNSFKAKLFRRQDKRAVLCLLLSHCFFLPFGTLMSAYSKCGSEEKIRDIFQMPRTKQTCIVFHQHAEFFKEEYTPWFLISSLFSGVKHGPLNSLF